MYSYGSPNMAVQKQRDQLELTYSSSVRIQDVALRTCQKRWTIGRGGEREGQGYSCWWHDKMMMMTSLERRLKSNLIETFKIVNGISNYAWQFFNISRDGTSENKIYQRINFFPNWLLFFVWTICLIRSKTAIV